MGTRLFVRNLSNDVDSSTLENIFSAVGDVASSIIEIDTKSGVEHRVAYVEMTTEQAALDSIDRLNGFKANGLSLIVTADGPHVPDPNFRSARSRMKQAKAKAKTVKTIKT